MDKEGKDRLGAMLGRFRCVAVNAGGLHARPPRPAALRSSTQIPGTAPAASPLPERSLGLIGRDGRPRMR